MKVVIAIDSFKGSLDTLSSGSAVSEGIKNVFPDAVTEICPLADGGEGTVNAIVSATGGRLCTVSVTGPLGDMVEAIYGVIPDTQTAVIEMSAAAGITLISPEDRDPLRTTTYGVGELIRHAITVDGCRKFIIGIGGSATNDGGAGMLSALGFELLDRDGSPIEKGAVGLRDLAEIRVTGAMKELSECDFRVACDVKNPLCGDSGCSAVYGPQKGATPESIALMDGWLRAYAALTKDTLGFDHSEFPGAGAAGGMGFAFISYLGGKLTSGIDLVIDVTSLEDKIKNADIVVTGEGRLDAQSAMGKAPVGVARVAKRYGKPVIAFAGAIKEDASLCNTSGIDAFFPILDAPCTLEMAMDTNNAYRNLSRTAEQVFRLIKAVRSNP